MPMVLDMVLLFVFHMILSVFYSLLYAVSKFSNL